MFIARVPNRNSPPAFLLRESYRENGKVKTRTLANLSKLPPAAIEALKRSLKGEQLAPLDEKLDIISIQAMTLTDPPQRPQTSTSMLNTRLSRCAQVIAPCRSAGERTSLLDIRFTPLPRLAGVTSPRQR